MYYYIITLWDFITKIYLLDRQKMLRRINIFIGYEINFQLSMKKDKNIWTFFFLNAFSILSKCRAFTHKSKDSLRYP